MVNYLHVIIVTCVSLPTVTDEAISHQLQDLYLHVLIVINPFIVCARIIHSVGQNLSQSQAIISELSYSVGIGPISEDSLQPI